LLHGSTSPSGDMAPDCASTRPWASETVTSSHTSLLSAVPSVKVCPTARLRTTTSSTCGAEGCSAPDSEGDTTSGPSTAPPRRTPMMSTRIDFSSSASHSATVRSASGRSASVGIAVFAAANEWLRDASVPSGPRGLDPKSPLGCAGMWHPLQLDSARGGHRHDCTPTPLHPERRKLS